MSNTSIGATNCAKPAPGRAEILAHTPPTTPASSAHLLDRMTHELRTPLNMIVNFAWSVESGMRGPINDEQRDYLGQVRRSGEHLLGMIRSMQILTTIDDGAMAIDTEALDVADLIQDVIDSTIVPADKPIELRWDIAPDLPPVAANHIHIMQVLCQLLANATKFTDAGTITVRAVREGAQVVLSVADNGPGIAAEHLAAIFEDFYQVNAGDDRPGAGMGLGLPICRRLVALYGGRIWVESTPGAGSTFAFSLPVALAH